MDSSGEQVPQSATRNGRILFALAFAGLLAFHVVNNIVWLQRDDHVHHMDEGYHVKKAVDMYRVFSSPEFETPFDRFIEFIDFRSPYPPLAHVTGALFIEALGYGPDHVTLSCTFLFVLILLGVYAIARQWMDPWQSLFAMFVSSFLPLLYGLSRLFSQDYFSAVIVVWAIYALIRSDSYRNPGWVFAFALLNGIGFLAKQTTFAFLIFPSAYVAARGMLHALRVDRAKLRRRAGLRLVAVNMLMTIAVSWGMFSWWYVPRVEYLYTWWSTQRMHGQGMLGAGAQKLLQGVLPDVPPSVDLSESPRSDKDDSGEMQKDAPAAPKDAVVTAPSGSKAPAKSASSEGEAPKPGEPTAPSPPPVAPAPAASAPPAPVPAAAPAPPPQAVTPAPPATAPAKANAPPLVAATATTETKPAPAPAPRSLEYALVAPFVESGYRYPIYLINDSIFLPTFIVVCIGFAVYFLRRPRPSAATIVVIWVVGTYVAMTWLFMSKTPRYLVPMVPALGILCVMAIYAIPAPRKRRVAQGIFAAILLLQYANLTYGSLGPLGRIEIPVLTENPAVKWCNNNGITVIKDFVVTGVYNIAPPWRGTNAGRRLLDGMAEYERKRPHSGETAQYRIVSRTTSNPGFEMIEREYGPLGNTLAVGADDENCVTPRTLHQMPDVPEPAAAMAQLGETDYLVLKTGDEDNVDWRTMFWARQFLPHGFELIDLFRDEGYGKFSPTYYALLAKKPLLTIDSAKDLYDLLDLKNLPPNSPNAVPPSRRTEFESWLRAEMGKIRKPTKLSDELDLFTMRVRQHAEEWFELEMVIIVRGTVNRNYRMYLIGSVEAENAGRLAPRFRQKGFAEWSFNPEPPTKEWKPGDMFVLRRNIMTKPMPYYLTFGLFDYDKGLYGNRITAGWVNFGAIGEWEDPHQRIMRNLAGAPKKK